MLGGLIVGFEIRLKNISVTHMLGALIGGAIGLAAAKTIGAALYWANLGDGRVVFLHSLILLGAAVSRAGHRRAQGRWLKPENIIGLFRAAGPRKRYKILDTSVIIDGRIADICETGFMDGTLVIPQFVLKELQLVADSSDSMKRNRGRRGLDILQKIQKMAGVEVTISDMDFPDVREVDLKLIELARTLQGKIVTNDFNLNKVAQLRGVEVLNINELANSLKPVVLPGEIMKVFILKEGKEYNQGVAYLDDGTMVVVDNARKMIGRTIDVVVTSVLQTTAGKMIFGRFIDAAMAAQAAPAPAPVAGRAGGGRESTADGRSRRRNMPPSASCGREHSALTIPPFHWWRTVFFLIPAIALYTIVLGTLSLGSSLFQKTRLLRPLVRAHVVAADPGDDRRARRGGRARSARAATRPTCSSSNHQSIYDIPILFWSLPYQLRIIAKESLGSFPFLGWHLRRTGHMLVDRRRPDRAKIFGWASRLTSQRPVA